MRRQYIVRLALTASILLTAAPALSQDPSRSPALEILERVVIDPTTYAPALVSFEAHHLDWKSSQVFFEHGFVEANPEFTVSGRANDVPIGYGAGNRKIIAASLVSLRNSAINNVATAILERALHKRYPDHRKLIRTFCWIERLAFASALAYGESAHHFRQWRANERLARQLGYD